MEDAITALEAGGATIVDKTNLPTRGQFGDAEYEVLLYEFKAGVEAYLATLGPGAPMKTLADLIAFNEAHAKEEMPYFGQDIFVKAQARGPLTDKAYLTARAKARRLSRAEGLDLVFTSKKVDALLAPSGGPAWLTDLGEWRLRHGRQLRASSGLRLPEHHRPGRLRARPAGRCLVRRPGLVGRSPDRHRPRLRAAHETASPAAVSAVSVGLTDA